jgi:redox-sensitive bicupin YhaK (pirin superfamily)
MIIIPRTGDIGNFEVHRALPFKDKRMVGPFIFWDQMGPGEFLTGQGVDVRPHPHIGLSTLTYLFRGSMDHKDSLGNDLRIVPGEINLMTAGSGIVHSERTGQDIRQASSELFGIQSWLAQPKTHEESDPEFSHIDRKALPTFQENGIRGRVILGEFHGVTSPVTAQWDTLYVDIELKSGEQLSIPHTTEERALYAIQGKIALSGNQYDPNQMIVLRPGKTVTLTAVDDVRLMILGGAAMDGERYIWWNFVSSSKERLEQAKLDWKEGKFGKVPGDAIEFIPLPE